MSVQFKVEQPLTRTITIVRIVTLHNYGMFNPNLLKSGLYGRGSIEKHFKILWNYSNV